MMEKMFMHILNMSFMGSVVIVFILGLRIALRKAPKKYSYILWGIALIRLSIPLTLESAFSLIPVNPTPFTEKILYDMTPKIETGIAVFDQTLGSALPGARPAESVNPMQVYSFLGTIIWSVGVIALLIYGIMTFVKLRQQLKGAYQEKDNIYVSKAIQTPFVLGILSPRIYLPDTLDTAEKHYVVLHEQMHIRRFDPIIRVMSYMVLCLHWFNPLVWLAYGLSEKDMEMSCDEMVLNQLGPHIKKEYSQSLLHFATGRRRYNLSLLAFGEGEVIGRVKNILNFKKPKTYLTIGVTVLVAIAVISLVSNPINPMQKKLGGHVYQVEEVIYDAPLYSFTYIPETAPRFNISSDNQLYVQSQEEMREWTLAGGLYEAKIQEGQLLEWVQFPDFIEDTHEQEIRGIRKIYRAQSDIELASISALVQESAYDPVYIIAQTQDERQLLFYGHQRGEQIEIRWIFTIKATT